MKRILVLLFLTLLATPLLAQVMPAQGPRPMQGRRMQRMPAMQGRAGMMRLRDGKWWKNAELAQKLNLTDQQIQKMEDIYQAHRLRLIDQVAAVQKAEVTLQPMLEADRPDETQVIAQIDKVATARAELEKSNARMLLGIRQVLTPEQWKQLKTETPPPSRMGMPGMRMRMPGPSGPQGPGAGPTPPPQPEEE